MEFGPKTEEPRMGQVSWSEELETGIDVMDQQHRRYIELLNDYLQKAAVQSDKKHLEEQLFESFEFLRRYAKEHFATEDQIMEVAEFPDYPAHKEEHTHFNEHVERLSRRLEQNGYSPDLARELNFYAIEWFVDHILESDMKLVHYLKENDLVERTAGIGS